jgi:hypothetical protein
MVVVDDLVFNGVTLMPFYRYSNCRLYTKHRVLSPGSPLPSCSSSGQFERIGKVNDPLPPHCDR